MISAATKERRGVGVSEASRQLNVLTQQTYSLLRAGRLKGWKVGNRWYVDVDSITQRLKTLEAWQALKK